MNERAYHSMKKVGGWNIVFGATILVVGIAVGVGNIIAGAKLLSDKKNITF